MKGFFKLACMLFVALSTFSAGAQTASSGKWYSGTGTATGKNMEQIRAEALNKARADAMKKAGVEVSADVVAEVGREQQADRFLLGVFGIKFPGIDT